MSSLARLVLSRTRLSSGDWPSFRAMRGQAQAAALSPLGAAQYYVLSLGGGGGGGCVLVAVLIEFRVLLNQEFLVA